jgi:hypothetical protein
MPSIRNGLHWIAGTSVAPNARDAETGRRLGLPDFPLMSISGPSYPWILKDLGWFEAIAGLRPTMARKTDKKLMIAVSLFLAKPQVTGLGNRQVENSRHQLSVLAGHGHF